MGEFKDGVVRGMRIAVEPISRLTGAYENALLRQEIEHLARELADARETIARQDAVIARYNCSARGKAEEERRS